MVLLGGREKSMIDCATMPPDKLGKLQCCWSDDVGMSRGPHAEDDGNSDAIAKALNSEPVVFTQDIKFCSVNGP